MDVTFWGTRGSLPTAMSGTTLEKRLVGALVKARGKEIESEEEARRFLLETCSFPERATYGGNTSCVQIKTDTDEHLICDMGSGARELAIAMMTRFGPGRPQTYHVVMSHLHWDHIMGFPFFIPAYIPGNRIKIYGCHRELEAAFRGQHAGPCFPVEYGALPATIEFITLEPGRHYDICGFKVTPKLQLHTNDSYGYRFEKNGQTLVYATDSEHKLDRQDDVDSVVSFFKNADMVIFDAMYSLADTASVKEDWGHSSNVVGVELCQYARVKKLCLFHHEPAFDDHQIHKIYLETKRYEEITRRDHAVEIIPSYDGLTLTF